MGVFVCGTIPDPQGDLEKHTIFKSVSESEKWLHAPGVVGMHWYTALCGAD